eukprot:TRINITY_DN3342_c0_g1_i2.p1 TRINITY_DN3342_c0_g1~~TRINITY_DN3342_c0_g1_i2.p1  ORF type:complete len:441 (+),score=98.83 TRINITY_DN3342_c0_g1_i2:218-1540(+)
MTYIFHCRAGSLVCLQQYEQILSAFLIAQLNKVVSFDPPLLDAFPSWSWNTVGDPAALQSVLGFEIDTQQRMWILDQGKVNGLAAIPNSIKLVIWDLVTNTLVKTHIFPQSVASLAGSFMNDVVVDTTRGVAYMTDSGIPLNDSYPNPVDAALVVYDFNSNSSRRLLSSTVSTSVNESIWITINGAHVYLNTPLRTGADGIALSCDFNTLWYCPMTSRTLWMIPTAALRDPHMTDDDLQRHVTMIGDKLSASDGLAATSDGHLLITAIERDGILQTPYPYAPADLRISTLTSNPTTMIWPDTMGFGNGTKMYFVSNQLMNFAQGLLTYDLNPGATPNFRVWSVEVGTTSYVNGCATNGIQLSVIALAALGAGTGVALLILVLLIVCCIRRRMRLQAEDRLKEEERMSGTLPTQLMSPLISGEPAEAATAGSPVAARYAAL